MSYHILPDISIISKYHNKDRVTLFFVDYFTIDKIVTCSNTDLTMNMDTLQRLILIGMHVLNKTLNYILRYDVISDTAAFYYNMIKKGIICDEFAKQIIIRHTNTTSLCLPSTIHVVVENIMYANNLIINLIEKMSRNKSKIAMFYAYFLTGGKHENKQYKNISDMPIGTFDITNLNVDKLRKLGDNFYLYQLAGMRYYTCTGNEHEFMIFLKHKRFVYSHKLIITINREYSKSTELIGVHVDNKTTYFVNTDNIDKIIDENIDVSNNDIELLKLL